MVCTLHQPVLMADASIEQRTMDKLGPLVEIEHVLIAHLDAEALDVRKRSIGTQSSPAKRPVSWGTAAVRGSGEATASPAAEGRCSENYKKPRPPQGGPPMKFCPKASLRFTNHIHRLWANQSFDYAMFRGSIVTRFFHWILGGRHEQDPHPREAALTFGSDAYSKTSPPESYLIETHGQDGKEAD
jgi:hypothetical protein